MIALSATSILATSAAAQPDVLDDVFYQFMPISWRDSTLAADTTRDTISGADRRYGDFQGMTDSLDYLQGLGVTAVWMNPIFPSPAYHGYQHGQMDQVNPWFGSEAEFLAFVAAAKAKGIKVYLDLVCYGISQSTTYYTSSFNNPASAFDSWMAYTNTQNTQFTGYSFSTWNGASVGFINWDLRTAAARNTVNGWCQKWLDPNNDGNPADGIAGYRLDHVWVNYNQGPSGWGYNLDSFWTPWKAALKLKNPNVFTFTEQADWGSYGDEFTPVHDAAFTKPFEFAARSSLSSGNAQAIYDSMRQTTLRDPGGMNSGATFLGIIGDHDVDRLASTIGANTAGTINKAKAAAAVLMLQPFPPIIYYGDELAMTGTKGNFGSDANDIPMREPFKWTASETGTGMTRYWTLNNSAYTNRFSRANDGRSVQEQTGVSGSVIETYRSLATVRKDNIALRRGEYTPVTCNSNAVWAFHKEHASQKLLVLVNLSGSSVSTNLNLATFGVAGGSTPVVDLLTRSSTMPALTNANKAAYAVTVPAYGYRVLSADVSRPDPNQLLGKLDGKNIPTELGAPGSPMPQSLALQQRPTGLGDNQGELNQLLVRAERGGTYIGIPGNLASGSMAIAVFLDTAAGGQTTFAGAALGSPPAGLADLDGLRFDPGFAFDRGLFINQFQGTLYVDLLTATSTTATQKTYLGNIAVGSNDSRLAGGEIVSEAEAMLNNTNTSGVTASSASAAADAVQGLEVFIPDALLPGVGPCSSVGICVVLLSSDGTVSNQILPPVTSNVSTLGLAPNFATFAGTQHLVYQRPSASDIDGDGEVAFGDFLAFFNGFDTLDLAVDLDNSGEVDFADFLAFFNGFDAPC